MDEPEDEEMDLLAIQQAPRVDAKSPLDSDHDIDFADYGSVQMDPEEL